MRVAKKDDLLIVVHREGNTPNWSMGTVVKVEYESGGLAYVQSIINSDVYHSLCIWADKLSVNRKQEPMFKFLDEK